MAQSYNSFKVHNFTMPSIYVSSFNILSNHSFTRYRSDNNWLKYWIRGDNFATKWPGVIILACCTTSHCHLSMFQVSLSDHSFTRYCSDKDLDRRKKRKKERIKNSRKTILGTNDISCFPHADAFSCIRRRWNLKKKEEKKLSLLTLSHMQQISSRWLWKCKIYLLNIVGNIVGKRRNCSLSTLWV